MSFFSLVDSPRVKSCDDLLGTPSLYAAILCCTSIHRRTNVYLTEVHD